MHRLHLSSGALLQLGFAHPPPSVAAATFVVCVAMRRRTSVQSPTGSSPARNPSSMPILAMNVVPGVTISVESLPLFGFPLYIHI